MVYVNMHGCCGSICCIMNLHSFNKILKFVLERKKSRMALLPKRMIDTDNSKDLHKCPKRRGEGNCNFRNCKAYRNTCSDYISLFCRTLNQRVVICLERKMRRRVSLMSQRARKKGRKNHQ